MTEPIQQPQRRPPARRKPSPLPVFLATAVLFTGVTGFLGVRMAAGQDPALGAKKPQVTAAVQPRRRVVIRKVIVTKHVTIIKPATPSAPTTSSYASAPASAPAQTYTPPAQTYTPAPAPAPAPVSTSTS